MEHAKVLDSDGNIIVDNLTSNCQSCLSTCDHQGKVTENCPEYGGQRRLGKRTTNKCTVFLCCHKTKTTKLFRNKLEALSYSYPDLLIPAEEIRRQEQLKVNRLVHNLTSINAHNIQEIYDLIPQEVLTQNWRVQIEFIEKEIIADPKKAAFLFLRIAKNNTHMKSEFSIYKKIEKDDNVALDKRNLNLRKALLNTLHTFFSDFTDRSVYVEVREFYHKLAFDYETIQVAFYHLLENACKYTLGNTKIIIDTKSTDTHVHLSFSMTSAHAEEGERAELMKEGVSGKMARMMGRQGDGIGMWRIAQMMEINGGEFKAHFGPVTMEKMSLKFSHNVFELIFKK